jgi:CRP-like cAMP-binding protein
MKPSLANLEILRNTALFGGLPEDELTQIIETAYLSRLEDGAFFFFEANPAEAVYVLLEGKVKLTQVTNEGQQVILGYLSPGRQYGIIAMLPGQPYPVSAQAVGKSQALTWDQATLTRLAERFPRIALNALKIMAGQIREFQNRVRELSTQRVERRIARTVLRLARQSGRKIDGGVLVDLPLSRQDIAEMTGTTLYTVSRVLSNWEERGLVKSERQQVIITYPHGLVSLAEDIPVDDVEPGTIDLSKF